MIWLFLYSLLDLAEPLLSRPFFLKTFKMENSNGTVLPVHSDRCKITGATKLSVRTAALARDANPTIQIKIACAMPALD